MNSDKFHHWLQLFGAASIVASLIFVGLQLMQSQEIAVAAQYQARYDSALEYINLMTDSDTKLRALGKGLQIGIDADPNIPDEFKVWAQNQPVEDLAYWWTVAYLELKTQDNLYFQYQSGFLDEDSWQALYQEFIYGFDSSGIGMDTRAVYEINPAMWRTSFREIVDELIAEIDAERN